jgi:hypothetical protein
MSVTVHVPRKSCVVLDWMTKQFPSIKKQQRIHEKCAKTITNLLKSFEMNQLSLQALNITYEKYRVFREQADWILILPLATSCETTASFADKNACAQPVLLAYTVYFFH